MSPEANPFAPPLAELSEPRPPQPPFFATSTIRLLLMSAGSFGLYPAWWSYQNWRAIRAHSGAKLRPAPRALFNALTNFSLFPRLQALAARAGVASRVPHELFAAAYLATTLAVRVADDESPLGLLLIAAVGLTYVPPNLLVQRLNRSLAPDAAPVARWTALSALGTILGLGLFLALLASLSFGELE